MNPEATHQPVLFEAIYHTSGPILELGAGESSTRQLHALTDRYIMTIDDNQEWITRYDDLISYRHKLLYLPQKDSAKYYKLMRHDWGVILIDSTNWDMRLAAIEIFKDGSDLIVLHDANYARAINIDFDVYFKYWVEYQREGITEPTTLLASNKIDVRKIKVNGAIKLSENE